MFIADADGQIINTAHIVSAKRPARGLGYVVTFMDGRTLTLNLMVSDLDELCGTTVPAPPGFMVYEIHIPSGSEMAEGLLCIDPRPVIAFRIGETDSRPVPITTAGAVDTSHGWTFAVRGPEGGWIGPDASYERAADFKRVCEQRLADAIARQPRKAA